MSDTLPKSDSPAPGYSQADWDEVSDNPELTDEQLAGLRPARDVPEVFNLLPKRGRGRPKLADAKVNLTLRVEPAVLDAYKATGPGWQVRMQEALAAGLPRPHEPERSISELIVGKRSATTLGKRVSSVGAGSYEVIGPRGNRAGPEPPRPSRGRTKAEQA